MRHKSSMKEAQNDNKAAHRRRRWLQREANRGEKFSVIITKSLLCLRIMRGIFMQAACVCVSSTQRTTQPAERRCYILLFTAKK